ncbi:MAG: hypothetical protein KC503_45820 [Myxococcales bacterium]|nr:hypothetical protein [Myxococcales bacterium]
MKNRLAPLCLALLVAACTDGTPGGGADAADAATPPADAGGAVDVSTRRDAAIADTTTALADAGADADAPPASDAGKPATGTYVGFGAITRGAASSPNGYDVYRVSSLADDGTPGTLRDAVSRGRRHIVFDVVGTITLAQRLTIDVDYLTIDGASAGGAGITIAQAPNTEHGVIVHGIKRHTHDLVFSHIRFRGSYDTVKVHKVGTAIFSFDADCGKVSCAKTWSTVDAGISAVVIDHVVVAYDRDKLTLWGKIRDVTISNSLFYGSTKALLLSFYGAPYDLERDGISVYRNAFVENDERNPQLRGSIRSLEVVNNVVYGWGVYGMRIKNEVGEGKVDVNVINNTFIDNGKLASEALVYLGHAAPPSCLAQGSVYAQSTMGKLWVAGNTLPASNCDQYSTVSAPLSIAARAALAAQPAAASACDVLASVGLAASARTSDENTRLTRARSAAACP